MASSSASVASSVRVCIHLRYSLKVLLGFSRLWQESCACMAKGHTAGMSHTWWTHIEPLHNCGSGRCCSAVATLADPLPPPPWHPLRRANWLGSHAKASCVTSLAYLLLASLVGNKLLLLLLMGVCGVIMRESVSSSNSASMCGTATVPA